jgi:TrmH family RNA methyltransferase
VISNPNNSTIRPIRKLRKRRERERRRQIIVEGHRALTVAVRSKADVSVVLHTPAATLKRDDLLRDARARGAAVHEVSPGVMASLTSVETAPDVLGVASMPACTLAEAIARFGFGTVLAAVRDPATAGSILSSCAAAGGSVAIATAGTTDLFAPKPVRTASGAHFLLAIAPDVDPAACAEALQRAAVRIVSVETGGRHPADADLGGRAAFVLSDDGALPEPIAQAVEQRVAAIHGDAGIRPSVGAEAAVVLFEAARHRGRTGPVRRGDT